MIILIASRQLAYVCGLCVMLVMFYSVNHQSLTNGYIRLISVTFGRAFGSALTKFLSSEGAVVVSLAAFVQVTDMGNSYRPG
jgi:hypothetical protein